MSITRYRIIDSPIGPLTLAGDGASLTHLCMQDQTHPPAERPQWQHDPGGFAAIVAQLEAYFAGDLTEFEVPLDLRGTDFQRQVWQALLEIPYGETWSYGQLAHHIDNPGAARAVGLANGRNPVAIIVPCHRVIGSNGTLVGYGGGMDRKQALLELERAHRNPRLALEV